MKFKEKDLVWNKTHSCLMRIERTVPKLSKHSASIPYRFPPHNTYWGVLYFDNALILNVCSFEKELEPLTNKTLVKGLLTCL